MAERPTDEDRATTIVCVPVTTNGSIDLRWGRAARVAVVEVAGGEVVAWHEHAVGWDRSHDDAAEGAHHARVARFLKDQDVDTVVAHHMGEGMIRMLHQMRIRLDLGATGPARDAVRASAAGT